MMRKRLINRVTVTGADDSVNVDSLIEIQGNYPFVEWGILLSKSSEGRPRFPSTHWLDELIKVKDKLALSGHLCGRWVRDICKGEQTLYSDRPQLKGLFSRYQLNFHAYVHKIKDRSRFSSAVASLVAEQVILQFDSVNNELLLHLLRNQINAVPLFDTSGGAGVLPDHWPKALDLYCGYAGGLSPENLDTQMSLIADKCGDGPIWIDAETQLRSEDNRQFDLDRVCEFLDEAKPWLVI